jgi:hypothetical protein
MAPVKPWLERKLVRPDHDPDGPGEVMMQVGLPGQPAPDAADAVALVRLHPLTSWMAIHGVDQVQAISLAIRMGEQQAEAFELCWPEGDPFRAGDMVGAPEQATD